MIQNKNYNTTSVFIAACLGLSFFGIAMLSLGVLLPPLKDLYPQANTLAPTMSVGIILGTITFGPVMDKFGYKWLLIAGTFVMLAGILGLAYLTQFALLEASIFCVGVGGGILNGETNALVSDIYDVDKRGSRISLLGACYCVGALLWTLANALPFDYKNVLIVVAAVMIASMIFFMSIKFPGAKGKDTAELASLQVKQFEVDNSSSFAKKLRYLLSFPAFIGLALVLFFQSGFEGISGSFTTQFFTANGMSTHAATLSLTIFTVGMLAGRFLLSVLMARMKDYMVFNIYLTVGLIGTVLIWAGAHLMVTCFLGMALLGFGIGSTYPVVFNVIGEKFRHISGSTFSIIIFLALWGQFVYNAAIGSFFNAGIYDSFPVAMLMNIVLMIIIAPIAINSLRKHNRLN